MGRNSNRENAGIYVIDDQYGIVYFNEKIKQTFPALRCGEKCYRAMCREDKPCRDCPAAKDEAKNGVLYNKVTQRWVEVSGGEIEWPGFGPCTMVMTTGIREVNKNLFYNLTSISAYDQLFEMNLTRDTYRILYHMTGKFAVPANEGVLSRMLKDAAVNLVHPEDREEFQEFWKLERLLECLQKEGSELKKQFRKLKTDGKYCWVSVIAVPLVQGAHDDKILLCFIRDIHEQKLEEQKKKAKDRGAEERDPLTGLYCRAEFFRRAEEFLRELQNESYCLMAVDIEHFKLFNQWYGEREGDDFLISVASQLKKARDASGGIAGYMGGDDFVIILPYDRERLEQLQKGVMGYVRQYGKNAGFLPAFGVYLIEDKSIPVSTMYDRASVALSSVKGNYAQRVCWYDSRMMEMMEQNHRLLSEVQRALDNDEFTYYLQPQCNMTNGKVVGLETLVRWIHPERGVISPGEFIPLLESNGLIASLDIHIWEKVCIGVRNWIDCGRRPVPVSVNVSRVDIYTIDVVEHFCGLVKKYGLEPGLLEIEITESACAEEYDIFTSVIEQLRSAGFPVFMDDFGSGYSSLNMLNDINVDVLKIDMKFLKTSEKSPGRGMGILETIINMAKFMELRMIAEGVETREQMDLLLEMGCMYGQGYYFYRPMPAAECEAILSDEANIDYRGIAARSINRMQARELMNDDIFSETMLNNILGGIGLFDMYENRVELLRVNDQYCVITGTSPVELEERRKNIMDNLFPEEREILLEIFEQACRDRLRGGEGELRHVMGDGSIMWMRMRAFFLREQDGHRLFYCAVSDITQQKKKERQLESSQRALAAVVNISDRDQAFMRLTEENRRAAASIFAQMSPGGMIGGYCEEGFPLYFANYEMVRLLGYDSYDELAEAIDGRVLNTIHPEDRAQVTKDIGGEIYAGLEYTTTYRMPKKDGTWFWTLDKGKVVCAEDGRLAIVSACTDISETMFVQQQLSERNAALLRQNQELHFLNNDMPGGYHRCARTPGYDFLYVSNRFLEIFGYTREELREKFDDKYMNMVHPDDRERVSQGVEYLRENDEAYNLEYRMLSKNGYIWVIDQSRYMEYAGTTFLQGIVLEVTRTVELRNKMKLLMKHMPESIALITLRDGGLSVQILAEGLLGASGDAEAEYRTILGKSTGQNAESRETACLENRLKRAMGSRESFQDVIQVNRSHGQAVWMSLDARFIEGGDEGTVYLCICTDVSHMKAKEQELWIVGKKMSSILRQVKINSWDWDMEKDVLAVSRVSGYSIVSGLFREGENERIIADFTRCVADWFTDKTKNRESFLRYLERVRHNRTNESLSCELPAQDKGGEIRWLKIACETICDEAGEPVRAVGYYMDITKEKNQSLESRADKKALEQLRDQELRLTRLAQTDALTGLYNRQAAIPGIKNSLQEKPEEAALIMFDLDNFKLVNDVFGHVYGDTVIKKSADKLKTYFRGEDIICRIGGDEFLIYCKNIGERVLEQKMERLISEMMTTCQNEDRTLTFSVSAGYAMIPEHGNEFDELYQKADIALFTAKTEGKGTYRKYEVTMREIRYELADEE